VEWIVSTGCEGGDLHHFVVEEQLEGARFTLLSPEGDCLRGDR
jgi:hypothetical protein